MMNQTSSKPFAQDGLYFDESNGLIKRVDLIQKVLVEVESKQIEFQTLFPTNNVDFENLTHRLNNFKTDLNKTLVSFINQ